MSDGDAGCEGGRLQGASSLFWLPCLFCLSPPPDSTPSAEGGEEQRMDEMSDSSMLMMDLSMETLSDSFPPFTSSSQGTSMASSSLLECLGLSLSVVSDVDVMASLAVRF